MPPYADARVGGNVELNGLKITQSTSREAVGLAITKVYIIMASFAGHIYILCYYIGMKTGWSD